MIQIETYKVRLPSSRNVGFICFNESSLIMVEKAFYFILKPLLFLIYLSFCPDVFGHLGKHLEKETW